MSEGRRKKVRSRRRGRKQRKAATGLLDLPNNVLLVILGMLDEDGRRNASLASAALKELQAERRWRLTLANLPTEILTYVASFLGRGGLGRLARVSCRFKDVADADWLWERDARRALVTNGKSAQLLQRTCPFPIWSAKERVRISRNWTGGRYSETRLAVQGIRYMPRIQLERSTLWVSWGNKIWAHSRCKDGTIRQTARKVFKGHTDDVSKFAVKDGYLVSGGRDRTVVGWNVDTGEFAFAKRYCHGSEVSAVDVVRSFGLVVTGSRDETVKIWSLEPCGSSDSGGRGRTLPKVLCTVHLRDRIWSLASESNRIVVGTAGLMGIPSLHVIDMETGGNRDHGLAEFGRTLKRGSGMLDVQWQSPQSFLSCGYDSCCRLWDTRVSSCVLKWEDPFNEAVYCFATDGNTSLVCGSARHGLVQLWDMRRHRCPVRMYYAKHPFAGQSSPVYSVAFDQRHLYVALDQSINLLTFSR